MRIKMFVRGIALTLTIAMLSLVLSTCGGSGKRTVVQDFSPGSSQEAKTSPEGLDYHPEVWFDDALAELDALETPDGVDEALWVELKDALEEALKDTCRAGVYPRRSTTDIKDGGHKWPPYSEGIKIVSTPPTGEANRVDDLAFSDDGEGNLLLTWRYRNSGDYDQSGTVGIADITPIAMHYGETYAPADVNCLTAVIDGSGNSVVDIADITPLAMNFGVACAEYAVQHAASAEGEFTETARVPLPEAADGERLLISPLYTLDAEKPFVRVVPYDSGGSPGVPSEPVEFAGEMAHVSMLYPRFGVAGSEVTFSAAVQGAEPLYYAWDFGGGAEPNESNEPMPTVTLAAEGEYNAVLTLRNLFGSDEYPFLLTTGVPPEVVEVTPTEGDYGDQVAFSAVVTGTEPITYAWDFGGGAEPSESEQTAPTVVLGETGDYAASVTATSRYGIDTCDFRLIVYRVRTWQDALSLDSGAHGIGGYTSLAVVNGSPAISYSGDAVSLRYVRATGAGGIAWEDPVIPDSAGSHTSLAVVNGNPAISYYGDTNGDLKYVRATDADGSAWGDPVTIDSAGDVGWHTSLEVVNGNPAISYLDATNGDLKYVRASDADGSAWETPVILDSASDVGYCTSLAVVNGNPAVSYYDYTHGNLKYVRASDANGSSWENPVTADSKDNVGWSISLAVVNGNPAISYYDYTNFDLKYVRASDADGSAWGDPVTPDSEGNVGFYTSLAVVDGNPAISYFDWDNIDLKYLRASDANGESWKTPVTVNVDGGEYTSLAVVNGNPAISFRAGRSLRFTIGLRE